MEDWQRELIRQNLDKLIAKTLCSTELLAKLRSVNVLSEEEVSILNAVSEKLAKSAKFYDIIQTKTEGFTALKEALFQQNQTEALTLLEILPKQTCIRLGIKPWFSIDKPVNTNNKDGKLYHGKFGSMPVAVKRNCDPNEKEILEIISSQNSLKPTCENIVTYLSSTYENAALTIILELFEINLQQFVTNKQELPIYEVLFQITKGVDFLHQPSCNILHLDLRPENVLLTCRGHNSISAKLANFRHAKKLTGEVDVNVSVNSQEPTLIVSWRAPEFQLKDGDMTIRTVTKATDVFSLGCIFYFVITNGKHPFGVTYERQANIVDNRQQMETKYFKGKHFGAFSLITMMLQHSPISRPFIEEVLNHFCFWDASSTLHFINDVVHIINEKVDGSAELWSRYLETFQNAENIPVISCEWFGYVCPTVRVYMFANMLPDNGRVGVQHLFEAITHLYDHFASLPFDVQAALGDSEEEFLNYWISRFPYLICISWIYFLKMKSSLRLQEYYSHDTDVSDSETFRFTIDHQFDEDVSIEQILQLYRQIRRLDATNDDFDDNAAAYVSKVAKMLEREHEYRYNAKLANEEVADPIEVFCIEEETTKRLEEISAKLADNTPLFSCKFLKPVKTAARKFRKSFFKHLKIEEEPPKTDAYACPKTFEEIETIVELSISSFKAKVEERYPFSSQNDSSEEYDITVYDSNTFVDTLSKLLSEIKFEAMNIVTSNVNEFELLNSRLESVLRPIMANYQEMNIRNQRRLEVIVKQRTLDLVQEFKSVCLKSQNIESEGNALSLEAFYKDKLDKARKQFQGLKFGTEKIRQSYLSNLLESLDNEVEQDSVNEKLPPKSEASKNESPSEPATALKPVQMDSKPNIEVLEQKYSTAIDFYKKSMKEKLSTENWLIPEGFWKCSTELKQRCFTDFAKEIENLNLEKEIIQKAQDKLIEELEDIQENFIRNTKKDTNRKVLKVWKTQLELKLDHYFLDDEPVDEVILLNMLAKRIHNTSQATKSKYTDSMNEAFSAIEGCFSEEELCNLHQRSKEAAIQIDSDEDNNVLSEFKHQLEIIFEKYKFRNHLLARCSKTDDIILGIHLGSTNCHIALYVEGYICHLTNFLDNNAIPSYVCISETHQRLLVGKKAKQYVTLNPNTQIWRVSRILQEQIDNSDVSLEDMACTYCLFPTVTCELASNGKVWTTSEFRTRLLSYLKNKVKKFLKLETLTVVTYTSQNQTFSGALANEKIDLIPGPQMYYGSYKIATELAFTHKNFCKTESKYVLCIKIGARNLHVIVLDLKKPSDASNRNIIANECLSFGGNDFVKTLMAYCVTENAWT